MNKQKTNMFVISFNSFATEFNLPNFPRLYLIKFCHHAGRRGDRHHTTVWHWLKQLGLHPICAWQLLTAAHNNRGIPMTCACISIKSCSDVIEPLSAALGTLCRIIAAAHGSKRVNGIICKETINFDSVPMKMWSVVYLKHQWILDSNWEFVIP